MPVKSGDRTVALLIPLEPINQTIPFEPADAERLAAVLARAEKLAKGRDPAEDDAALAQFGDVDPTNWSEERWPSASDKSGSSGFRSAPPEDDDPHDGSRGLLACHPIDVYRTKVTVRALDGADVKRGKDCARREFPHAIGTVGVPSGKMSGSRSAMRSRVA